MTPQHTVRVAFLDVGQGDSIVISIPATGEAVIVDCPEADTVIEYLKTQQVRHIRALIVTHLHLDHYKDTVKFLENCGTRLGLECEHLIFNWQNNKAAPVPDYDKHSELYDDEKLNKRQRKTSFEELYTWARENEAKCEALLRRSFSLSLLGSLSSAVEILQPSHAEIGHLFSKGLNNTSAIIRVRGASTSALLTSDIEPEGWRELKRTQSDLQCDVLKFPHHGAWRDIGIPADPSEILDTVQPSVVIISVGTEGIKYGHPNKHVFQALSERSQIRFFCTQATIQCGAEVQHHRQAVVAQWEEHSKTCEIPLIRTPKGCPCAGTVILELGESVQIIQPDEYFHREQIIRSFFPAHKCTI